VTARDPASRRAKVRAALASVTGCPAEWTGDDGNTHLCILLAAAEHQHLCQCGATPPPEQASPGLVCPACGSGDFSLQLGGRANGAVSCRACGLTLDSGQDDR